MPITGRRTDKNREGFREVTGCLLYTSTVSFKSKKKVRKPESEWFRVENTHEPIIDKEVFYRVQELSLIHI